MFLATIQYLSSSTDPASNEMTKVEIYFSLVTQLVKQRLIINRLSGAPDQSRADRPACLSSFRGNWVVHQDLGQEIS